jgi:RHS repeat-associated protein
MIAKRYLTGGINSVTNGYANTTALVGFTTSFDRASNKLYERHLHAESRSHLYQPFNTDGSWGMGYDSANRLRQYQRGVLSAETVPYHMNAGSSIATPITLPGADQVRTYGLDGIGNWKTTNYDLIGSGGSVSSTAEVRQHNYLNEITSVKDIVGGGSPSTTPFAYDQNGNLLNDGVRSYQWDALNRLVQVKKAIDGTVIGTYTYDVLNRRVQKVVSNGGLTGDVTNGSINYLYDGQQIVMELDNSSVWKKIYFWGQYIDELLFFAVPTETAPTTYRVLSDLLYRSVAIVTTSNVISEAYDCDAYGNTICYSTPGTDDQWFTDDDVPTNNPTNLTIFTGRQFDAESSKAGCSLYYYRARYYSANIGRFISRDPIGVRGGINLYAYVRNKSPNALDPLGLDPAQCCCECVKSVKISNLQILGIIPGSINQISMRYDVDIELEGVPCNSKSKGGEASVQWLENNTNPPSTILPPEKPNVTYDQMNTTGIDSRNRERGDPQMKYDWNTRKKSVPALIPLILMMIPILEAAKTCTLM